MESNSDEREESAHLDDVEAGAGCTGIWEKLSETREQASD